MVFLGAKECLGVGGAVLAYREREDDRSVGGVEPVLEGTVEHEDSFFEGLYVDVDEAQFGVQEKMGESAYKVRSVKLFWAACSVVP